MRPRGTEPKIKLYVFAKDAGREAADALLNALEEAGRKQLAQGRVTGADGSVPPEGFDSLTFARGSRLKCRGPFVAFCAGYGCVMGGA